MAIASAHQASAATTVTAATSPSAGRPVRGSMRWWAGPAAVVHRRFSPEEVATPPLLDRNQIGFDSIQFTYQDRPTANDPAAAEFRDAFIRLKQKAGLYSEQPAGVSFIGGTDNVFQSAMWIPANAPDGHYTVDVYLFSGNALLAHEEGKLEITKVGFEQFMFAAAHEHALLYGLACVLLALFTGWLAGVIFRRD